MANNLRALRAAIAEPWAITAEGLETILSVAARENSVSIEALEAYRARHVPTAERLEQRGPVAILSAVGPMFRRANIFTEISGATSYEIMRRDLQAALDDPATKAIVLNLDTPGGTVNGVDEMAKAILDARSQKPIIAYVGGLGASAGYWLASQASEIVISDAAILGSIGVRMVVSDTSKRDAERGQFEFISSQSPGKRADVQSDEGRSRIQRTVDALADVFIAAVAKGRGIKAEDVVSRFGGGDVLVGAAAVAAGMADRIGTFEAVISELAEGRRASKPSGTSKRTSHMTDTISKADHEAAINAARTDAEKAGIKIGAAQERDRIRAILSLDEAAGREKSARHLALETDVTADVAKGILAGLAAEAAPAPPVADQPMRAQDAPGGLVTVDPIGARPPSANAQSKEIWGKVVNTLNGQAG